MKLIAILRCSSLVVSLFWLHLVPACAQPAPKGFDTKIAEAWKKVGAEIGWFKLNQFGDGAFYSTKPSDDSLPAFRWYNCPTGAINKLPPPSRPFALQLYGPKVRDEALKDLTELKNLQTLDFGDTQITDAGLKDLGELKNLQALNLGTTRVTNAGLRTLAALENLRILRTSWQVTDVGLMELSKMKGLQVLSLHRARVTGSGLKHLAGLDDLRTLDLSFTSVASEGLKDLAELKNLQTLNLNDRA